MPGSIPSAAAVQLRVIICRQAFYSNRHQKMHIMTYKNEFNTLKIQQVQQSTPLANYSSSEGAQYSVFCKWKDAERQELTQEHKVGIRFRCYSTYSLRSIFPVHTCKMTFISHFWSTHLLALEPITNCTSGFKRSGSHCKQINTVIKRTSLHKQSANGARRYTRKFNRSTHTRYTGSSWKQPTATTNRQTASLPLGANSTAQRWYCDVSTELTAALLVPLTSLRVHELTTLYYGELYVK